jgi:hypothetical protein
LSIYTVEIRWAAEETKTTREGKVRVEELRRVGFRSWRRRKWVR